LRGVGGGYFHPRRADGTEKYRDSVPGAAARMSLRMKRQSKKAKMFGVDNGVPGAGAYSHADVKDIGNTRWVHPA
jgi:hypothetical protein